MVLLERNVTQYTILGMLIYAKFQYDESKCINSYLELITSFGWSFPNLMSLRSFLSLHRKVHSFLLYRLFFEIANLYFQLFFLENLSCEKQKQLDSCCSRPLSQLIFLTRVSCTKGWVKIIFHILRKFTDKKAPRDVPEDYQLFLSNYKPRDGQKQKIPSDQVGFGDQNRYHFVEQKFRWVLNHPKIAKL